MGIPLRSAKLILVALHPDSRVAVEEISSLELQDLNISHRKYGCVPCARLVCFDALRVWDDETCCCCGDTSGETSPYLVAIGCFYVGVYVFLSWALVPMAMIYSLFLFILSLCYCSLCNWITLLFRYGCCWYKNIFRDPTGRYFEDVDIHDAECSVCGWCMFVDTPQTGKVFERTNDALMPYFDVNLAASFPKDSLRGEQCFSFSKAYAQVP